MAVGFWGGGRVVMLGGVPSFFDSTLGPRQVRGAFSKYTLSYVMISCTRSPVKVGVSV